ncbi:MAG: hypothetical protein BWY42_00745 [Candidatus Omnitrophica bacterium ADurb.Bin277]|nr:MAG: hypothetical protein BWY42_00745 [Candidatus Omnitrophica bacterium ADurb.Bin277]
MLKTFEEHLKNVAAVDNGDFHDRLRERIGKKAAPVLEKRLKDMILLTPHLLLRIYRYGTDPETPQAAKTLAESALIYFYHPKDFIPDGGRRLFGYLDDAYYIALLYERILRSLIRSRFAIPEFDKNYLKQIKLVRRGVKLAIPGEAPVIEETINSIRTEEETGRCPIPGAEGKGI